MGNYIYEKLQSKEDNGVKKVYEILKENSIDDKSIKEILERIYNLYTMMNDNEFNEEEFSIFLKGMAIDGLNTAKDKKYVSKVLPKNGKMTVKVTIDKYPNIYRIFRLPKIFSFGELAFATFAAFNAVNGEEYVLVHKDIEYYQHNIYKGLSKSKKIKDVNKESMQKNGVNVSDKLIIKYGKDWVFNLEVLDIQDTNFFDDKIELIDSKGMDILEGKRSLFECLVNGQLQELKELCESEDEYRFLLDYYEGCSDEGIDNQEFDETIDMLFDIYHDDFSDDLFYDRYDE